MKNKALQVFVLALAIAAFAVAPAFARGGRPPVNSQNTPPGGGTSTQLNLDGIVQTQIATVLADMLGVDVTEIEARLAAGETMSTILIDAGYDITEVPALVQSIREQAWLMAVESGLITAEQYEWIMSRMYGGLAGGVSGAQGTSIGSGTGICTGAGTCTSTGTTSAASRQNGFSKGRGRR